MRSRDRRGVFVSAYVVTTGALRDWIERGRFQRPSSVSRYIVAFANKYLVALNHHVAGEVDKVPAAWRASFESAARRHTPLLQELLLGINAHVNHDLPYAALDAELELQCEDDFNDFTAMNDALHDAMPEVRRRVVAGFQPGMRIWNFVAGPWIDRVMDGSFRKARADAWSAARALADARTEADTKRVNKEIHTRSAWVARRILENKKAPFKCAALLAGYRKN